MNMLCIVETWSVCDVVYSAAVTFDISVDDHVAMEVEDSLQDLSGVSACHLLGQSTVRL